jgi:hypothetical protein
MVCGGLGAGPLTWPASTRGGGAAAPAPEGRLSHITGIDDEGARMIEVWRSGEDAKAHAERSAPFLANAQLPAPSRVFGFEVTSYVVS